MEWSCTGGASGLLWWKLICKGPWALPTSSAIHQLYRIRRTPLLAWRLSQPLERVPLPLHQQPSVPDSAPAMRNIAAVLLATAAVGGLSFIQVDPASQHFIDEHGRVL